MLPRQHIVHQLAFDLGIKHRFHQQHIPVNFDKKTQHLPSANARMMKTEEDGAELILKTNFDDENI